MRSDSPMRKTGDLVTWGVGVAIPDTATGEKKSGEMSSCHRCLRSTIGRPLYCLVLTLILLLPLLQLDPDRAEFVLLLLGCLGCARIGAVGMAYRM